MMFHALQDYITEVLEKDTGSEQIDNVVRQALVAWLALQRLEPSSEADLSVLEAQEIAEASSVFALAKNFHDSNLFSEGEQHARHALELRTRLLGSENIDTKSAKLLLASLLKKQKKLDEAIPLYEELLAANRQSLGDQHEETLACMNNLAVLLKQKGKLDDAQALYEEALRIKRNKLGQNHTSTLTSMSNLAGLLKAQGKLHEARVLYEESLEGHKSALGPQHPDTLTDMWNFALFLNKVWCIAFLFCLVKHAFFRYRCDVCSTGK
jgi:tetratricopeptide (TPR) repeat protein